MLSITGRNCQMLKVYYQLKKICPSLDSLNIGGGLPIRNSLGFEFDYEYLIEEIILQIKNFCDQNDIPEPNIFTEFGSFTVGESGAALYSVLDKKWQNDRELWYMIDSSFITTLPDTWGINQRFIMLGINHWDHEYQNVNLGGLTCDSLDYYNSELHTNEVYLPKFNYKEDEPSICRLLPYRSLPGIVRRIWRNTALPDTCTQACYY